MNISYKELDINQIDLIKPLWEKLKLHHGHLSAHFKERYVEFTFQERKAQLLNKSENGTLRVEIVQDKNKNKFIGYCISSISNLEGEIDSIYLDEEYRSFGIGKELMEHALKWMDENKIEKKKIIVAAGNEDLLSFYEFYDFFPRHIILEQK